MYHTTTMMPFHPALIFLLFILIFELQHAYGSSTLCAEGVAYNKSRQTVCNSGYEKCKSSVNVVTRILSASVECSKVQSECMVACYVAAVDRCKATPSRNGENSGSNDESNDDHESNESTVGEFFGVVITVGAVFIVYLVSNKGYKRTERVWVLQENNLDEVSSGISTTGGGRGQGQLALVEDHLNTPSHIVLTNNSTVDASSVTTWPSLAFTTNTRGANQNLLAQNSTPTELGHFQSNI